MILKYDCKHFPGDRPCSFHKSEGVKCDSCPYYEKIEFKILIIKLDAIGDVLRTTSILQGLKERYPQSEITWLTRSNSFPLFVNNPLVDKLLSLESYETNYFITVENFNVVLNLDPSPISSAICTKANGYEKLGFGLDEKGKVTALNDEAIEWFEMGAFDDIKKKNTKTYQSIIQSIARINSNKFDIILRLTEDELKFAEDFRKKIKIVDSKKIIGMNTGASPRWQYKQWTYHGFENLVKKILDETDYYVFLYGGHYERERNLRLSLIDYNRVINTGTDNSLRQFFTLLNLCDLLVTGDTLAMHAATALNKKVIALFGPTSAAEIETYERITKITSDLDCLVCYKMTCDFNPNCMNSISHLTVFRELQKSLQTP
jgi:heptosyltransferase-2